MPLVKGERIKMADMRPTVIKQLEPQGVSVLYPVTPRRVSIYSNSDRALVKTEYEHLKGLVPMGTQNRAYRRKTRKPLRPNNLRRLTRAMKAAWDETEDK